MFKTKKYFHFQDFKNFQFDFIPENTQKYNKNFTLTKTIVLLPVQHSTYSAS